MKKTGGELIGKLEKTLPTGSNTLAFVSALALDKQDLVSSQLGRENAQRRIFIVGDIINMLNAKFEQEYVFIKRASGG